MKRSGVFIGLVLLLLSGIGAKAQWLPATGMEGAPCDGLFLIDSTLVTNSTPAGITVRHVDSVCWEPKLDLDIMGYAVAGQCIMSYFYNTFYRSFDAGETWDTLEPLNVDQPITFTGTDSVFFVLDGLNQVKCSYDYGASWNIVPSPSPTAGELYIFSHDSSLFCLDFPRTAIFETTDHGNLWTTIPLTGLPPTMCQYLMEVCRYGGTWWATSPYISGIYKFSVANNSWSCMNDTLTFDHFKVLNNVLYGYGNGIWQLNANWNAWISRTEGLTCYSVTGLGCIDTTYYCVSEDGPFRAMGNLVWQPFMTGLYGGDVQYISSLDNEVWICLRDNLYHSSDYGADFESVVNYPGCGNGQKFIMTDSLFYLKDQYSFFVSDDHGISWKEEVAGLPPDYYGKISDFSVGESFLFMACQNRLYRSAADPVYWEPAPINQFGSLHALGAGNSTLVMAGLANCPICISHDNGNTVDTLEINIPGDDPILKYLNGRFYVFAGSTILYSADNGYTWDTIPLNIYDFTFTDMSATEEATFSTGYGYGLKTCDFTPKVFITYDEGLNWTSIADNLEHCGSTFFGPIHLLGTRVFLGSSGNGFWYRDDILTGTEPEIPVERPGMSIFPNPAATSFLIKMQPGEPIPDGKITIRSVSGQIVVQPAIASFVNGTTTGPIDISNLSPGMYLVSFSSESGPILHAKFLKQ
ncbi:MAG TPA: T9SS type A sorting domain-containing protein [Bacteroidales bacterium]|nr:T9SS type A sorting domain-containing protein [Bacteroidales bacterium]HPS74700.1 T9SS type A sorting domain-containing protein [Bacteroidales bacterium]